MTNEYLITKIRDFCIYSLNNYENKERIKSWGKDNYEDMAESDLKSIYETLKKHFKIENVIEENIESKERSIPVLENIHGNTDAYHLPSGASYTGD